MSKAQALPDLHGLAELTRWIADTYHEGILLPITEKLGTSAAAVLALVLLTGCATAADLKPGVTRGIQEDGFEKTTEGLALTVTGRPIEAIWTAALRGATAVSRTGPKQAIIAQDPPSVIKIEGKDFLGWTTIFYVGVFVSRQGDAVQVQVSKFYRSRMAVVEYGPSEGDYLRAIRAELAQ